MSDNAPEVIGAYEAKTNFSELIARAEKGEAFIVTKNGRAVARILPADNIERENTRTAAARLRSLLASQGPPVPEQDAQRNWEELKRDLEIEDDGMIERWPSLSTPR
ncbi:MAG: type II toxin-antitoxin system prevent-host-death family antitoxin [Hyphomicrobiales bacterium]|nr:type II toxin-antitoxin system prevent-host-death family antitoxin [Hyphomicrobiales bacterium]